VCGIFGVIQNDPDKKTMAALCRYMHQACHVGIFRGNDSTGLFQVQEHKDDVFVHKLPISGEYMASTRRAEQIFNLADEYPITIGHHRAATRGAVSLENCHPFEHYDTENYLIGVHNGSFNGWKSDEDKIHFNVDSDWGLYQIWKHGDLDGLSRLDGAYALVWYRNDGKIRVACNAEREFHWGFVRGKNAMVMASEHPMMYWLADRNGLELEDPICYPAKGKMFTFDPNNVRDFKEEVIPERPKAQVGFRPHTANSRQTSATGIACLPNPNSTAANNSESYEESWERALRNREKREGDGPNYGASGDDHTSLFDVLPPNHTESGHFIHFSKDQVLARLNINLGDVAEFYPDKTVLANRRRESTELPGTIIVGNEVQRALMTDLTPAIFYNLETLAQQERIIEARVLGVAKCPPAVGSISPAWEEVAIIGRPLKTWVRDRTTNIIVPESATVDDGGEDEVSGTAKVPGPNGKQILLRDFLVMVKDGCAECSAPFEIKDALNGKIVWAGSDVGKPSPLCKVCAKHHFGGVAA